MRVLVTGGSGLIGSSVVAGLTLGGHEVYTLVRSDRNDPNSFLWNVESGTGDLTGIESLDAVVHLAGESIANKRWSDQRKEKISSSRIMGTRLLIDLLKGAELSPKVFVSGSAIGFYGSREGDLLDESSPAGRGFLAELTTKWENEARRAEQIAGRVVILRTGIVLSSYGGTLAKQLPLFRLGLGGSLGGGRQFVSWIHLEDEVSAILFLLEQESIRGPVNLVSPNPVTNTEFAEAIARTLRKPMVFRAPVTLLELAFGKEFAHELLLASQRVVPAALVDSGFEFRFSDLEDALVDPLR